MPHFESSTVAVLFYALCGVGGLLLLWLGYRVGRWIEQMGSSRLIASREQELFTAQKGFKNLYEKEIDDLKKSNEELARRALDLEARVEAYRRKAAGFGGLFTSAGKRAEAMYALLLENEALEEALLRQNEKLGQERSEALQEQIRSTGYRRILISQLLNDERIRQYVGEVIADDKRLPTPQPPSEPKQLP